MDKEQYQDIHNIYRRMIIAANRANTAWKQYGERQESLLAQGVDSHLVDSDPLIMKYASQWNTFRKEQHRQGDLLDKHLVYLQLREMERRYGKA